MDAAIARWGGARADWVDLSTGINPVAYPIGQVSPEMWSQLPDERAMSRLSLAARAFWNVPDHCEVLAAGGSSSLIAAMPGLRKSGRVEIPGPTYNEHEAAFRAGGWEIGKGGNAKVIVNPNNPDGRIFGAGDLSADFMVIDESFADVTPDRSLVAQAGSGRIILKSLGKFWGLAGMRLGFAIGDAGDIAQLRSRIGPWAVSGPALEIGARALEDVAWAEQTRARLKDDAARLDQLMQQHGALVGGCDLFRLYDVGNAQAFQARLAEQHIWSRVFPYSNSWVRLGLPGPEGWARLEAAL